MSGRLGKVEVLIVIIDAQKLRSAISNSGLSADEIYNRLKKSGWHAKQFKLIGMTAMIPVSEDAPHSARDFTLGMSDTWIHAGHLTSGYMLALLPDSALLEDLEIEE